MSLTNSNETERVSKVTFSAINSEALVVSIRSIIPKPEELAKMNVPKISKQRDAKKKSRSRSCSEKSTNKSTMTEYRKEISIASQTSVEEGSSSQQSATPCLKHAAQNIAHKAKHMPSERVSLCNTCSKSMLSYIFVVQDFLDSLAKEICSGEGTQGCVQCMREQVRGQIINRSEETPKSKSSRKSKDSYSQEKVFDGEKRDSSNTGESYPSHSGEYKQTKSKNHGKRPFSTTDSHPGHHVSNQSGTPQQSRSGNVSLNSPNNRQGSQSGNLSFIYPAPQQTPVHSDDKNTGSSTGLLSSGTAPEHYDNSNNFQNTHPQNDYYAQNQGSGSSNVNIHSNEGTPSHSFTPPIPPRTLPFVTSRSPTQYDNNQNIIPSSDQRNHNNPEGMFGKLMQRQQPDSPGSKSSHNVQLNESDTSNFSDSGIVTSPLGEEISSGIISGLSNVEREVYDSARNNAGWENLVEAQERLVGPDGRILSEAYVTLCRNNAEAIGALVLGTSLLLTQTSRTLCVVVSDGVSMAFRGPLSAVFHVVQTVRSMDSLGTTKLALLEQPELGISFDKLNLWRLKQFRKCVYLNPDTLVIQNCDELFNREELSAVPDIGWPDCFNCGVFVLRPSDKTFWQLLEFSDKHGSHDGGDQGLLNAYFKTWSSDINKKLSFIYNLMANVSYTYTPAFKQFGHDVKIVQFHGSFKPWHVKFFNVTGLISPVSNVHPNYVEFVNRWIKIFKGNALRQLSQEIQSYAASQELICAVELLRFFPLPSESEAEFFLTPPSVRLRLAEMKLRKPTTVVDDPKRRKSAEFRHKTEKPQQDDASVQEKISVKATAAETTDTSSPIDVKVTDSQPDSSVKSKENSSAVTTEGTVTEEQVTEDPDKLPGAEVGNYQGMKKWEQGKMDYEGKDSSDSVIKRLEFLMTTSK